MANFVVDKPLMEISAGNTDNNTISFGSFGQAQRLRISIKVITGTVRFAVNGAADAAAAHPANSFVPDFIIRDGIDVINFDQALGTDVFLVGVSVG